MTYTTFSWDRAMKPWIAACFASGSLAFGVGPLAVETRAAQAPMTTNDVNILATEGFDLTKDQAAALEGKVRQKPDDVESRIKLLGYYSMAQEEDPEAKK